MFTYKDSLSKYQSYGLVFPIMHWDVVIDRYRFFITDTDYLYVYVPDNRYAEPIFIYCYKVHKEQSEVHSSLSVVLTTTNNC